MDSYRRLLYGRSLLVSRQLGLLACGLFALLMAAFYTNVVTLWPLPLVPSGAVLLVGLAAIEAYYNEGLLVAWLLTFVVTVPAFFFPPRGFIDGAAQPTALIAVVLAGGVAVAFGTIGFAIGVAVRHSREQHRTDRYQPSATVLPAVLLGRDDGVAMRAVLVAAGGFTVLFVTVWSGMVSVGAGLGGIPGIIVLIMLMTVPGLLYAAHNSGLLVCWALAFAPLFGVFLARQLRFVGYPTPDQPVLYALGSALLFAIPLGTVGFLFGVVVRRIHRQLQSPPGLNASPD